jgi:hypothetical protein
MVRLEGASLPRSKLTGLKPGHYREWEGRPEEEMNLHGPLGLRVVRKSLVYLPNVITPKVPSP